VYDGAKLFVCECSHDECGQVVELSLDQYQAVRSDGARFLVVHGHQLDPIERVAEQHAHYAVVEKLGRAGALARSEDPRQR
jgi:UDP-2,3-diacylglucosamine pyrophosphatase LpxH